MKDVVKKSAWLLALGSLALLAGCNSFKKKNIEPPTPLDKHFTPTVQVSKVWTARIGDGAGISGVRLRPTVVDGVLYAVSTDGKIAAFDAASGKQLWEKTTKVKKGWFGFGGKKGKAIPDGSYAGSPAVAGNLLAVGTLDGYVYGMNPKDGSPLWSSELDSEVTAAPAISGDLVIARTQDGRVYGLDAATGKRRWVYDQGTVPSLSLRGYGTPLAANGVVFIGSDDGKLVALRQDNGEKLWEQRLANGDGRTDIERLDDADGTILLDGSTLYGSAYHGDLTAIDGPSGRPLWSHPFSTYTSLSLGGSALYGVDDQGEVWAFDRSSGSDMWKDAKLKYRWLTGPAVQGNYVVVADAYGFVHWLQTSDGALAARIRLSKKPIQAQPLVVGDTVYVEDVKGHIGAYRLAAH
ncbi:MULTISPECIES: outer membrane protein assembly factor BamB [Rhodanobacter]|uniref:Outer membrane protein assembly factor BamB n=1 Tax=Rhodanobacter hydrolyticus TaxID=2250595 RepID=A0ABW8J266_9GAMM|nr:outer membrane protein assembly factor BamB [Rhodanobacter sp. 7MK24]MBD8880742.1 outer membrane protein assembly factor BamB [Rhodanobacter sp. 7MK24]